jgi:hypothetical protein
MSQDVEGVYCSYMELMDYRVVNIIGVLNTEYEIFGRVKAR